MTRDEFVTALCVSDFFTEGGPLNCPDTNGLAAAPRLEEVDMVQVGLMQDRSAFDR